MTGFRGRPRPAVRAAWELDVLYHKIMAVEIDRGPRWEVYSERRLQQMHLFRVKHLLRGKRRKMGQVVCSQERTGQV
jgi:hypothetical protein